MEALILLSDWQKSQIEFWRKTQYDGYDVSTFGRVRSWWVRISTRKSDGTYGGTRALKADMPHLLKLGMGRGYFQVSMNRKGRRISKPVHRLVAAAFLPNPENLPQVNHINCIKSDSRLGNLERISRQGNMDHAVASGLILCGEAVSKAKATESLVRSIRQRKANGESVYRISKDVGLKEWTVTQITRRKTWKHVT